MAGDRFNGVAIGSIAVGGLLTYAGIKGYSIPATIRKLISGQSPAGQAQATGLAGTAGTGDPGSPSSVAAGVSVMEGGTSETAFQQMMLSDLGAPATAANLSSLHEWFLHEEPSFPPPNLWNPLNIRNGAGGFAQYGSAAAGARATASFITGNGYNAIRLALMSGNGLCGNASVAGDLSRWSGGGYSSVC